MSAPVWRKVGNGRVLHALVRHKVDRPAEPLTRYIVAMVCQTLWWNRGSLSDYSDTPGLPKCKRCLALLAKEKP